jgi:hypothetical protein
MQVLISELIKQLPVTYKVTEMPQEAPKDPEKRVLQCRIEGTEKPFYICTLVTEKVFEDPVTWAKDAVEQISIFEKNRAKRKD